MDPHRPLHDSGGSGDARPAHRTVTFLFTDVEGSTRLLERLGERYQDVQYRHDAILRTAITEGDGREVSTEGDSFFAVFPAPAGAVQAAAQAQRQLAATAWPDGAPCGSGWDCTPAKASWAATTISGST